MDTTQTPFERRKEEAWTRVYEDYWWKFGLSGPVRDYAREAMFREAIQQTTDMFTTCDNDLDLADYLVQMREILELALRRVE